MLLTALLEGSLDLQNENATHIRKQNASTFATKQVRQSYSKNIMKRVHLNWPH